MPENPEQLELNFTVSTEVKVTRFPDGEVRMKPQAPKVEGTVNDAAKHLGISPRQVRRLIAEKEIPAWKPGSRHWKVDMAAVYDRRRKRQAEQRDS